MRDDLRLPIAAWLGEHFPAIRQQVEPCARRAAREAGWMTTSRILDPDDFLLSATSRILDRAPRLYPEPVSFRVCCRILCSFMLSEAANERRKTQRRRRLDRS